MAYKILRGISSDTLGERYEAGETAELDGWDEDTIAHWLKSGVLQKAPAPRKRRKPREVTDEQTTREVD